MRSAEFSHPTDALAAGLRAVARSASPRRPRRPAAMCSSVTLLAVSKGQPRRGCAPRLPLGLDALRRELPAGGAAEDRGARRHGADLAFHRPRCRPTRPAPSPSNSPGCTASTGCRSPSGCRRSARTHAPPLNVCLQVNIAARGQQGRRARRRQAPALAAAVARAAAAAAARPDVHAARRARRRRAGSAAFAALRALLRATATRAAPGSTRCRWA